MSTTESAILIENVGSVTSMIAENVKLFTIFPVNLFIVISIAGIAFALLRKGKKSAIR
mgnify:CR=1 FL=1|jgi:hypothetical protein